MNTNMPSFSSLATSTSLILSFVLLSAVGVNAQGIEFFHGSWEEALAAAKQEDKPIFVDAYASWCGPCKQMAKNVFPQAEVGEVFNANFISLKLDMEKPEAATFRANHPVRAYPTLFFLDSDGEMIHKVVGGQRTKGLIAQARTALSKVDNLAKYQQAYDDGDRDPDFVHRYVRALIRQGQPHLKVANDQLRSQRDQLDAPGNLKLMLLAATDADSRIFDMLVQHRTKIESLISPAAFGKQVELAFQNTQKKIIEFKDEDLLAKTVKKYQAIDAAKANGYLLEGKLLLASASTDLKAYQKAAKNYYKKAAVGNRVALTNLFQNISTSRFKTDSKMQDLAITAANEAAELSGDYQAYYRLAKWLNESGRKEEALTAAEKSKALIPEGRKNLHVLLDHLIQQINS